MGPIHPALGAVPPLAGGMMAAGAAAILFGVYVLRPKLGDVDEFFDRRGRDRPAGRFDELRTGLVLLIAVIALLAGIMTLVFGFLYFLVAPTG